MTERPVRFYALATAVAAVVALLLTSMTVGPASPRAAAAEDTTPPVVKIDRALHFVVGSTLSDSTSTPVVSKATWKWRQSDPSGICDEFGSLRYYPEGADRLSTETYFEGVRTSWTFPLHLGRFLYSFLSVSDCAGNTIPSYDFPWEWGYDQPSYDVQLLQESAATYSAGWVTGTCRCWSGGNILRSTGAGQTATFTGTFTDFGLVTTKGPGRGKADIYVDGVKRASINDSAATTTNRRVSFRVNIPGAVAEHTVTVRVTSGRIDIDAFLIN